MNRVEALTARFEYQKTATNEFSLPLLPFLLQLIVYALAYFDLKKYALKPKLTFFLLLCCQLFSFAIKKFKKLISRILLLQNCRNFQYILPCQPNRPKYRNRSEFILVFIVHKYLWCITLKKTSNIHLKKLWKWDIYRKRLLP